MTEEAWSHAGLAGTFAGPAPGSPAGPAVLIVAGSGPTDRDGNNPSGLATDTYRMLAAGWAAAGIRSLRYDKRGVGASAGLMQREEDLRFDYYVNDAVAAVRDLSSRADVSSVVIAGHSEGGLIAILATKKISVAGIALMAAPGRSIADLLREQFSARLPPELKPRAFSIIDTLAAGGRVADVPSELALAFRPSVQPYLASMINIDPAKELPQVKTPVLLLYGARDLQVSLTDRDALAKVRPDAQVVTLPEANHIMKRAPADAQGNFKTYTDRSLPLDPGVLTPLVDFVRKVAR
jgi:pimeloyl-ACP methyl ester carboxylesterase